MVYRAKNYEKKKTKGRKRVGAREGCSLRSSGEVKP